VLGLGARGRQSRSRSGGGEVGRLVYSTRVRVLYALFRAVFSSPSYGKAGLGWARRRGKGPTTDETSVESSGVKGDASTQPAGLPCKGRGTRVGTATVTLMISTLPLA
jgi:hypothetical protein